MAFTKTNPSPEKSQFGQRQQNPQNFNQQPRKKKRHKNKNRPASPQQRPDSAPSRENPIWNTVADLHQQKRDSQADQILENLQVKTAPANPETNPDHRKLEQPSTPAKTVLKPGETYKI